MSRQRLSGGDSITRRCFNLCRVYSSKFSMIEAARISCHREARIVNAALKKWPLSRFFAKQAVDPCQFEKIMFEFSLPEQAFLFLLPLYSGKTIASGWFQAENLEQHL
jgi:hypothetical protein